MMTQQLTVAQYYATYVVDGRAYVDGSPEQPRAWISKAIGSQPGAVLYCICHSWIVGIKLVSGEMPMSAVPWQKAPTSGRPAKEQERAAPRTLATRASFFDQGV